MAWHGSANHLLSRLRTEDQERLEPALEPFKAELKDVISRADEPMTYAVFPVSAVFSIVSDDQEGAVVEVATVGREGFLGIPLFLGSGMMKGTTLAQIPGDALRVDADQFVRLIGSMPALARVIQLYTQALFTQLSQSVVCNRVHSIQERCCRWLLLTHDRVETDEFPLTQEFVGQMLGVRRGSVSLVASELQRLGIIKYSRGRITILDRSALEDASCRCYRIVRDEFARLLGGG